MRDSVYEDMWITVTARVEQIKIVGNVTSWGPIP